MHPRLARLLAAQLEARRPAARADMNLLEWAKKFLPDHCSKPFSPLHQWLAAELDQCDRERGRKINLIGPRGAAKSTIATLVYPLRCLAEAREPYVWIISDTKGQAETHLENIRHELATNAELHAAYGKASLARQGAWTANQIRLANGCIAESYGTGQRIRGRRRGAHRPTLILCDDLQNDSHSYSPIQRAASRSWFRGTLLKAGRTTTNVCNVGTALHREALAPELMHTAGWTARQFAAIESWPERMDLWHEWEQIYADPDNDDATAAADKFFRRRRKAMTKGARVLWPEEEDLYALMKMRAEEGHVAFEREKQNSPIDPERCEWPESYFDDRIWYRPEELPPIAHRTLALDPAASRGARVGDFSAWVLLRIDDAGILYVDAELSKEPAPAVIGRGIRIALSAKPQMIGIEANTFAELLQQEWRRQANLAGLVTPPSSITNTAHKELRIRAIGPYLAQRRIRFNAHSAGARELVNQLRDFPIGDHDDGPDALEMAIRMMNALLGAQQSGRGPSKIPLESI